MGFLSALHHEEVDQKDTNRVTQYEKWADELMLDMIDFPVSLRAIGRFEKLNGGIKVNVYGFDVTKDEGIYPLRISERKDAGARHVDLMLLTNAETRHYCWVKNLSRLLTAQVTDHLLLPPLPEPLHPARYSGQAHRVLQSEEGDDRDDGRSELRQLSKSHPVDEGTLLRRLRMLHNQGRA